MKIAVLLTCFNRKDKTCACLNKLYSALDYYNSENFKSKLSLEVFLVDDGCTDGTANAVMVQFQDKKIHIIQGTGSLFWAGGMRLAWSESLMRHQEWDFYLLLNDDTDISQDALTLLMQTHEYCIKHYNKCGIYSGATCAKDNSGLCTYGGNIWINKFKGVYKRLSPLGIPQICDMANANILLVPSDVVNNIGTLSYDYQHSLADFDYTIRARNNKIPVLLTSKFCGSCDRDHIDPQIEANRVCSMSFFERMKYFQHPLHSIRDYLRFIYNTSPMRLPIVFVGRVLNLFCPKLYYRLNKIR